MSNDLSLYAAIASGVAALVSAWFAYLSIRVSKRSLRLSEQQEERRHPHLVPYLIDGYVKFVAHENLRVYGFSLSISNRSDVDDSVAQIELQLTYKAPSGISIAVKAGHDTNLNNVFAGGDMATLPIPLRIDAHQTIAGWVCFGIKEQLFSGSAVDKFTIIVTDSHNIVSTVEPIIVRELVDETAKS
jgi:hypothetical protein